MNIPSTSDQLTLSLAYGLLSLLILSFWERN
jgi:hypothetical protein